jgi:hypothetical protein
VYVTQGIMQQLAIDASTSGRKTNFLPNIPSRPHAVAMQSKRIFAHVSVSKHGDARRKAALTIHHVDGHMLAASMDWWDRSGQTSHNDRPHGLPLKCAFCIQASGSCEIDEDVSSPSRYALTTRLERMRIALYSINTLLDNLPKDSN